MIVYKWIWLKDQILQPPFSLKIYRPTDDKEMLKKSS
jgi:hypothetical protein